MSILNATLSADSYAQEDATTRTPGAYNWTWIGQSTAAATRDFTFVKFDLSPIPSQSIINSALLKMYLYNGSNDWSLSIPTQVRLCASSWVEGTVCWNNRPSGTGPNSPNCTVSSTNYATYVVYNVTTLVNGITNGSYVDYGFNISQNGTTANSRKEFYSKEYSAGAYKPILEVDYMETGIVYINTGAAWVKGFPYVKNAVAWTRAYAYVNTGAAWALTK